MQLKITLKPVKLKWLIEDSEGLQLAEAKQSSKWIEKYQVLAPDGGIIARIHKKRGLAAFRNSYRIDISRGNLDPLLILSYAVLIAEHSRAAMKEAF